MQHNPNQYNGHQGLGKGERSNRTAPHLSAVLLCLVHVVDSGKLLHNSDFQRLDLKVKLENLVLSPATILPFLTSPSFFVIV